MSAAGRLKSIPGRDDGSSHWASGSSARDSDTSMGLSSSGQDGSRGIVAMGDAWRWISGDVGSRRDVPTPETLRLTTRRPAGQTGSSRIIHEHAWLYLPSPIVPRAVRFSSISSSRKFRADRRDFARATVNFPDDIFEETPSPPAAACSLTSRTPLRPRSQLRRANPTPLNRRRNYSTAPKRTRIVRPNELESCAQTNSNRAERTQSCPNSTRPRTNSIVRQTNSNCANELESCAETNSNRVPKRTRVGGQTGFALPRASPTRGPRTRGQRREPNGPAIVLFRSPDPWGSWPGASESLPGDAGRAWAVAATGPHSTPKTRIAPCNSPLDAGSARRPPP